MKQGATVLRTTGYAWDNADQITSQTVNGVTTNYGYDLAGQLTSEVRSGYNVAYTYDANGNRLSKTVNGVAESYTYDLADKMLTAGAKSYTYDAAGRTVGINAPGGTTTLSYDYESRVTAITGPGINETHTYNGLDTRVGTVQGGVSRTFVRDGSYVTDPVLRDGQATYTPGVSERRGGVSTWSHSGLKNADAQTTSVGAIAATRVYDAFGAELSATGTWKGPFGYAGGFGYQEDSSGLKLLGHRYYDPTTGRFLSRDRIKDGGNWYLYCDTAPMARHDWNGLEYIYGGVRVETYGLIGATISVGSGMDPKTGRMGNYVNIGVGVGGAGGAVSAVAGRDPDISIPEKDPDAPLNREVRTYQSEVIAVATGFTPFGFSFAVKPNTFEPTGALEVSAGKGIGGGAAKFWTITWVQAFEGVLPIGPHPVYKPKPGQTDGFIPPGANTGTKYNPRYH